MRSTVAKPAKKEHWGKHKPNCIRSSSSLHDLFEACRVTDELVTPVVVNCGFLHVNPYCGNLLPYLRADDVLFWIYKLIVMISKTTNKAKSHLF